MRAQNDFRVQGPVRVVQRLASDRDQIGLAALQDLFRMLRVENQADRHGFDAGFLAHPFCERNLETGIALDTGRRRGTEQAAGRAVDHIHAMSSEFFRQRDRVVQCPAAFDAID